MESEMRNSLPDGFEMGMMLAPAIEGAKMTNVSVCTSADFMFIPKKSKNIEVAKDFLKFMCRDDMLKLFTQHTGTPRPFKYDADKVEGLSDFGKSVCETWKTANKVYMYSDNPIYFMKYYYWPFAGAPYSRIQIGDETAQEAFNNDFVFARTHWEEVREELGLS
jgi:ABC-type glycerol-3-phosphate transport system substrate-binding protein